MPDLVALGKVVDTRSVHVGVLATRHAGTCQLMAVGAWRWTK